MVVWGRCGESWSRGFAFEMKRKRPGEGGGITFNGFTGITGADGLPPPWGARTGPLPPRPMGTPPKEGNLRD